MAKKFSVNNIDEVCKIIGETDVIVGAFDLCDATADQLDKLADLTFEIRKPTLADIAYIVESAYELSFTENEDGTEEYTPEFTDFAIKRYIIERLTNINIPQDTEKQYKLIKLMERHTSLFYCGLCDKIRNAVDKKISHKLNMMAVAQEKKINKLIEQFTQLAEFVAELTDNIDSTFGSENAETIMTKLNELVERAEKTRGVNFGKNSE